MQNWATSYSRASRATHFIRDVTDSTHICPSLERSMTMPGHVADMERSLGILGKRGCQCQLQNQSQDLRVGPPFPLEIELFSYLVRVLDFDVMLSLDLT